MRALWFHPAARLIASRLSLARETLVDQTTILLTRDRRAYAEALLAFAIRSRTSGITPLIGRRHLSRHLAHREEEVMSSRRLSPVSRLPRSWWGRTLSAYRLPDDLTGQSPGL